MIHVSELCFEYPNQRALHQLSFEIAAGSVTALVGANGAGKTTLLRCIAGLDTPLSGRITVAGVDVIEHPRKAHRLIGYLSDSFGLYEDLTVAQCLEYAASAQGLPASAVQAAVQQTAQRLELFERLSSPTTTLSRGMRQRVAIGQAIIHKPKLLLLDEPASGLDPEARANLAGLFRQLQAEGMTLLVSSHILAELDEYSTAMLALRDGRLLEQRNLQSSAADDERIHLHVQVLAPDDRVSALLAAAGGQLLPQPDTQSYLCLFSAAPQQQASLLATLVQHGIAVTSFTASKENLQQSYLRSLANAQEQAKAS